MTPSLKQNTKNKKSKDFEKISPHAALFYQGQDCGAQGPSMPRAGPPTLPALMGTLWKGGWSWWSLSLQRQLAQTRCGPEGDQPTSGQCLLSARPCACKQTCSVNRGCLSSQQGTPHLGLKDFLEAPGRLSLARKVQPCAHLPPQSDPGCSDSFWILEQPRGSPPHHSTGSHH